MSVIGGRRSRSRQRRSTPASARGSKPPISSPQSSPRLSSLTSGAADRRSRRVRPSRDPPVAPRTRDCQAVVGDRQVPTRRWTTSATSVATSHPRSCARRAGDGCSASGAPGHLLEAGGAPGPLLSCTEIENRRAVRFAPVMYEDYGPATNATSAATSSTRP